MPPRGNLDIVFLLDARPAGRPWARAVRDNIRPFFETLGGAHGFPPVKNWRAKVVGYRDGDAPGAPAVVDHPFVSDVGELEAQFDRLRFAGFDGRPRLLDALRLIANTRATERRTAPEPGAWRHQNDALRFAVIPVVEPFAESGHADRDAVVTAVMAARVEMHVLAPARTEQLMFLEEADRACLYLRPVELAGGTLDHAAVIRDGFAEVLRQSARRIQHDVEVSHEPDHLPEFSPLPPVIDPSSEPVIVPTAAGPPVPTPPDLLNPKEPAHMSQLPKVKGIADIVFLLDATGSMGPCINAVKNNIKTFVQTLTTPTPNGGAVVKDWRAKIMGYRDLDYTDVPAIVDNPFVSSVPELEAQLNALNADGGGDEPETLLEALYMLANMPSTGPADPLRPDAWRDVNAGRRFVIVFTDAPFKEPLRLPKGALIDDVILNLMTAKVVLHMFAPASLSRFGTLEEVDKALWYKIPVDAGSSAQKALEDYTTDQSKFEKIIQLLAKTMTQQSGGEPPSAD